MRVENETGITHPTHTHDMQQIVYAQDLVSELGNIIGRKGRPDKVILLTDENTHRLCRPLIDAALPEAHEVVVGASDVHKTLDTLSEVWTKMQRCGATRHSLMVNLGGGMVTDLGGFAAATFKRGIRFVNVPTSLLAMVDAAVGGKTGINFGGLKNEIGSFADAETVVVSTDFLRTLDAENLCSGYAEMLKHALLSDQEMWLRHLDFKLSAPDFKILQHLVAESIDVKQRIVTEDPHEHGLRKALNLGHTVGHAFESLMLEQGRPVLHGYAVAWGMVCELFMSSADTNFPTDKMHATARFILEHYDRPLFTCDDYDRLYELMLHDKKNVAGCIHFSLLSDVGEVVLNHRVERDLINDAFDFLREA